MLGIAIAAVVVCGLLSGVVAVAGLIWQIVTALRSNPSSKPSWNWVTVPIVILAIFFVIGLVARETTNVEDTEEYRSWLLIISTRCNSGDMIQPDESCLHPQLGKFYVTEQGYGVLEDAGYGPLEKMIKVDRTIDGKAYGFQAFARTSPSLGVLGWYIVLAGPWQGTGMCTDKQTIVAGQQCLWGNASLRIYAVDQLITDDTNRTNRHEQPRGYAVLWGSRCSGGSNNDYVGKDAVLDGDSLVGYLLLRNGWKLLRAERLDRFQWRLMVGESITPDKLPQACRAVRVFRTQSGETLSAIALRERVDLDILARYNGIEDPDEIGSWDRIFIPPSNWR